MSSLDMLSLDWVMPSFFMVSCACAASGAMARPVATSAESRMDFIDSIPS